MEQENKTLVKVSLKKSSSASGSYGYDLDIQCDINTDEAMLERIRILAINAAVRTADELKRIGM